MNSYFYPREVVFIRHSQTRMITPLGPIKWRESSVTLRRSRNRPNIVFTQSLGRHYFAICQSKRCLLLWVCTLIISWGQTSCWISLLIGHEPFFHILLILHKLIVFFVNNSSWRSFIRILTLNKARFTFLITEFFINSLAFRHVVCWYVTLCVEYVSHINDFINWKSFFNIYYGILFIGKIFRINNDPLIVMSTTSVF